MRWGVNSGKDGALAMRKLKTHRILVFASLLFAGAGHSSDGTFEWVRGLGEPDYCEVRDIVGDGAGGVYAIGHFFGTVDFDGSSDLYELTTSGFLDGFLCHLDKAGNLLWAYSIGGNDVVSPRCMTIDSNGDLLIAGSFRGAVDFAPGSGILVVNSGDCFVLKLDADAGFQWVRTFDGPKIVDVDVSDSGLVYLAGHFQFTADFDPGPATHALTTSGKSDGFLLALGSDGDFSRVWHLGGPEWDHGTSVVVDVDASVYFGGSFGSTLDLDPGIGTYAVTAYGVGDLADGYVIKLDDAGEFVWAQQIGGTGYDSVASLAVGESGSVYASGAFQDTASFGGSNELTTTSQDDLFLAKYDSAGSLGWCVQANGLYSQSYSDIAVDAFGSAYVSSTCVVDVVAFVTCGMNIRKWDRTGSLQWDYEIAGASVDGNFAIALEGSEDLYTGGYFSGSAAFDGGLEGGTLDAAGNVHGFVLHLGLDGDAPNAVSIARKPPWSDRARTAVFSVEFDETVERFDGEEDLVFSHDGTLVEAIMIEGGPLNYEVTIDGISGNGSFSFAVNTSSDVVDSAGNPLASSVSSDLVFADHVAPRQTLPVFGWPAGLLLCGLGACVLWFRPKRLTHR